MRSCAVAALVMMAACSSTPTPDEDLPSMTEVRSDAEEQARRVIPKSADTSRGIASFQKIDLPLDQSVDEAWALVNEGAFPELTRGVWNANGLRVGLLARSDVNEFVRKLPPAQGLNRSQLLGSEHPTPILRTPRLTGQARIDLTVPPMSVREVEVSGGRLQLLARLVHDDRRILVLDLLPHHHVPRLTLEPRSPLEKQLDGRIFNELGLRVEIPSTHMLVVGLYRPWPGSPADEDAGESDQGLSTTGEASEQEAAAMRRLNQVNIQADKTGRLRTQSQDESGGGGGEANVDLDEQEPLSVDPPPLPNHLGRAFFASRRVGQNIQTLMLITIEPVGR